LILDSCFNGRFIDQPSIANQYIYGKGQTVAVMANTVNVLQDIWANEFIGLLSHGARLGQFHMTRNYIESHIIGDPTIRFAPSGDIDLAVVLQKGIGWNNMQEYAESRHTPLRCLAVHSSGLSENKDNIKKLADLSRNDSSCIVRLEALRAVARARSEELNNLIKDSIDDPFELIRRKSALLMGEVGLDEYAKPLIKALVMDPSRRVSFNAKSALNKLDPKVVKKELDSFFNDHKDVLPGAKEFREQIERLASQSSWLPDDIKRLEDRKAELKKRLQSARTFRNYRIHCCIPILLSVIESPEEPAELRITIIEALGWFGYSHKIDMILAACKKIAKDSESPAEVRAEAEKTINRLICGPNEPLTP